MKKTELRFLPVILLTTRSNIDDVVTGFAIGADDYVAKPVDPRELVMRVRAKIERPPVPVETLETDRKSGLLNEAGLMAAVEAELQRAERGNYRCAVAAIDIYEHARLLTYFGHRAEAGIANTFGKMLLDWARPLDVAARLDDGTFIVFMPECDPDTAGDRLEALTRRVVHSRLQVGEEEISITPISGYSEAETNMPFERSLEEARIAAKAAESHLDLRPMPFDPLMVAAPPTQSLLARAMAYLEWFRLPFQILLTYVIGFLMPFGVYVAFGSLGFDITQPVYYGAVTVMLVTCVLIWAEGFLSLKRTELPEVAEEDFGGVTAIIAAYLPNEAPTLESTIEAFLRMDYPAEFKVILAYNTPVDMPIEARLREIARADPRFVPFRVPSSRSKAQNVNAALSLVRTPVVAVYDADHQPDPDSFRRAWRWMADGADVVQGHCLIRNGESSWVARTVAIEFEQIYAVNHYGRMKLHDFGLFGGSNGFWRADLLRELRMRGSMLTEDIDSSIRAVQRGCRIVSDPLLISRELAPTTLKGLTNQRLQLGAGLVPGGAAPDLALHEGQEPVDPAEGRHVPPAGLARGLPLDVDADRADRGLRLVAQGLHGPQRLDQRYPVLDHALHPADRAGPDDLHLVPCRSVVPAQSGVVLGLHDPVDLFLCRLQEPVGTGRQPQGSVGRAGVEGDAQVKGFPGDCRYHIRFLECYERECEDFNPVEKFP